MLRYVWGWAALLFGVALLEVRPLHADDLIGQECMPRAGARFAVGDRIVPPRKVRHPFTVKQAQGDWLWIGNAWIKQAEVIPLAKAESYYTRYLRSHPRSAWALRLRGVCKECRGRFEEAIKDYSSAIGLEPSFAAAYCKRGRVFCELQQFSRGIEDLDHALNLDPEMVEAYWVRGFARELDGQDHYLAIHDLDRAVELAPQDAYIIGLRGSMFILAIEFDRAIEDLDRAIGLDPSDAKYFNNRGYCWLKKNDCDRAIKDLTEAIRLDPNNAVRYYNRAVVKVKTKDLGGFLEDLEYSIRLDPDFTSARFLRAIALTLLGDRSKRS